MAGGGDEMEKENVIYYHKRMYTPCIISVLQQFFKDSCALGISAKHALNSLCKHDCLPKIFLNYVILHLSILFFQFFNIFIFKDG